VSTRTYLSIGDVLSLLRQEFPDITISKIRFLESQGLVDPERSPSGYRKFYEHDVERLRWVLRQQREHFLPLKVIRDRLATNGENNHDLDDSEVIEHEVGDEALAFGGVDEDLDETSTQEFARGDVEDRRVEAPWSAPSGVPTVPRVERDRETRDEEAGASHASVASRRDALATAAPLAPKPPAATSSPVRAPSAPQRSRPAEPEAAPPKRPPAKEPAPATREAATTNGAEAAAELTGASLTLDELCAASGLATGEVGALESLGLVEPLVVAGALYYDEDALTVARLVADFARFGIEPRHLRQFRNATDRELGLIEQVVTPLIRQRNPEARQRAVEAADELSRLGQALRACLLRRSLRHHLGG
jgi:DNA-binding transcriptional MerR regulator